MSTDRRVGLLADEDPGFRAAAAGVLTHHFGFSDIVEASSLDEALECLSDTSQIEAALFDLWMPGVRTPSNLRVVRERFPNARLGIMSASNSRRDILLALEAGVHGYMTKSLPAAELVKALRMMFEGGIYVPPCLAEISFTAAEVLAPPEPAPGTKPFPQVRSLTARQRDVLDLLIQGKTNKEIALALQLGGGTVKIHMAAIFRYFGVATRAAAAVAGARPYPNRSRGALYG
jgi:DNA-binding NarL/FixJ family response regulator